jgi:hypothetical protein
LILADEKKLGKDGIEVDEIDEFDAVDFPCAHPEIALNRALSVTVAQVLAIQDACISQPVPYEPIKAM